MSQQESVEELPGTLASSENGVERAFEQAKRRFQSPSRVSVMLWTMIALAILSQFFRSSNGVVAPQIMHDLNLDAAAIGLSSGAFFVIFAALQIPIGVLFDRYGARRVVSYMLVFSIIGSGVFAVAQSGGMLVFGRFLIGFGLAGGMVGSLVILSRWHSPTEFTRSLTLLFAAANLGSLLATSPLAASADWIGWRSTFIALGVLTALIGVAFYTIVRDAPGPEEAVNGKRESLGDKFRGVGQVFRVPGLLCVLPMVALGYSSVITVIGLWGAPYLHDVYGIDNLESGNLLSILAIAYVVGTLAFGPIQRRIGSFRKVVLGGGAATGLLLIALATVVNAPLQVTLALLVLVCVVGAFSVVLMGHGVALIPKDLVGRGTTALNFVLMGGTAVLQIGSGLIVDTMHHWFGNETAGYAAFFAGLGVLMLIATAIYIRTPEPRRDAG